MFATGNFLRLLLQPATLLKDGLVADYGLGVVFEGHPGAEAGPEGSIHPAPDDFILVRDYDLDGLTPKGAPFYWWGANYFSLAAIHYPPEGGWSVRINGKDVS